MKKHNKTISIPSFLEIFLFQRVQIQTPRGGSHQDKTKYDRKNNKKIIMKEWE